MTEITLKINDKEYKVKVAITEEEKETGLSTTSELQKNEGMLFVYDEPLEELYFTMKDTDIDLDIIFIDEDSLVISVNSCRAHDPDEIYEEDALYVLEVNINSGILEGDLVEGLEDSYELTDDDKAKLSTSKMLVLDEAGNVQMLLEGGERIVSRKETKQLIKAALKAYHLDSDLYYKKVGKLIFKILDNLDSRDPEYVLAPD